MRHIVLIIALLTIEGIWYWRDHRYATLPSHGDITIVGGQMEYNRDAGGSPP